MDVSSIFNLPTALESDGGGTNAGFKRVTANRAYEGQSFFNGILSFEFNNPMHRWWHPGRSYFRMRINYGKIIPGVGGAPPTRRQLELRDGVAPSQNMGDHIFQTAEYQAMGQPLCKIYQHMPQIGALKRRCNESSTRPHFVGRGTNFEEDSFIKRQVDACADGWASKQWPESSRIVVTGLDPLNDDDMTSYIFRNNANQCIFNVQQGTVAGRARVRALIRAFVGPNTVGEVGGFRFRFKWPVEEVGAGDLVIDPVHFIETFEQTPAGNIMVETAIFTNALQLYNLDSDDIPHYAYATTEIMFQLPLPIFDLVDHAIPGGKHTFLLNPHTQQQLFRSAFQSQRTSETADTMFFEVKEMYFMAFCVDNEAPSTTDILLDFRHIRLQLVSPLSFSGSVAKQVEVRPTTSAIAIAFQDIRCANSSMFPEAVFGAFQNEVQPGNVEGTMTGHQFANLALALQRFSLEYAGTQYPVPDADLVKKIETGVNVWTHAWMNTLVSQGTFSSEAPESYATWLRRGPYFFFLTLRPGMDRSTRVAVTTQWDSDFHVRDPLDARPNMDQTDMENVALMVFDFSRQAVKIRVTDGQYSDITIEEQ